MAITTTYPTTPPLTLRNPPPPTKHCILSFPTPQILLVTLNRPESLNCINVEGQWELDAVWKWLDDEPSMRVGIITGRGRGFCAGMDLKEWNHRTNNPTNQTQTSLPQTGFAALSRRTGKKPIISAVNGLCLGGGMELITNTDLVLARSSAQFALPEVLRGVFASAGVLPRLALTLGRQRAMEMALTGRRVSAEEGKTWGFVNRIAEDVVGEAVAVAKEVAGASPDAVIVSRAGVGMGWEAGGVEEATRRLVGEWGVRLEAGANFREGLRAFVEKREPRWVDSKL
ncbi:MAG: hypothetical protein M1813_002454 [Trichoglossum hirsutum]|nr:MAG: hypothetical protein M1813_002454 [Trichoglossum hirsutum]